ncbi:cysteine--tRNA ligase [Campylobacter troglodytis]|uniref:cysteine--tRNA ligase n=1 Tax=Campylobacter troglodytis TaxID=654363 RepID=UPI00115803A5|nr:cysteine--tRNA ligase [Campylobacter troglodytis]TQR61178.1 cysteine--tRNA ligase [Campylobacter troglodytis]
MRLYDSKTKAKIELNADKNGIINIYLCGATVYDDAHLGHARSAVCFDLLHRTLLALGFCVNFARNYTDLDDKILNKMKEQNLTLKALTEHYIKAYEADMKALNVLEPKFKPRATEYISQMIKLIESLEKKGFTYTLSDGVYFDSSKDSEYLSLSHRTLGENQSRLENEVAKKNESDFVLWKFDESFDPTSFGFDENFYPTSPFGKGRPGWHTECVAMINALFDTLHIHCGGADLLFPHHENEAAQHRCACGGELARIWLHNGFVKIKGEKMSKSLNNSFFIKDALREFNGEVLRFYLLQTHYRSDFNYALSDLEVAKKRLDKLYRLKKRLNLAEFRDFEPNLNENSSKETQTNSILNSSLNSQNLVPSNKDTQALKENSQKFKFQSELAQSILKALSDDLNVSLALSFFDEFIISSNAKLDESPKNSALKESIETSLKDCAMIFGVGFINTNEYFQFGVSAELKTEIEAKIAQRNAAKKAKNFTLADELRDDLARQKIILQDTAQGTIWEKNAE